MRELKLREGSVRQISGDDTLLVSLYRQALAFAYPSLHEGFGIPPLEAMSLDCPVLCSDASSIPEVVGDAACLFDPTDVGAICNALDLVIGSSDLRAQLIQRGRKRASQFTWERCAEQSMEVYRDLAQ